MPRKRGAGEKLLGELSLDGTGTDDLCIAERGGGAILTAAGCGLTLRNLRRRDMRAVALAGHMGSGGPESVDAAAASML